MFQKLLNPDNALMITMSQITDCIFLSLFWIVGCFPLITAGAATAALYDASVHAFRKNSKHGWQRFFKTFRENWKAGIVPGILVVLFLYLLSQGCILLWNAAVAGTLSWTLFSAGAFVAMVVFGMLSVVLPTLSRFENSFAGLLKNSLLLSLANLPRTVALGVFNTLTVFLCIRYVYPLFFLPALAALIGSLFLEPMFKPYMPSEEAAA